MPKKTVRDATLDVLRSRDLTPIFANPGSTEIELLSDLPGDLPFVLGLHESSVIGMATGWAIGRGRPALAIVHTTAGLGNAVGALATARVNRAPLVVLVGQQDRRHLALEPFLSGKLRGLAGEYPVSVDEPMVAQDVPAAIGRAFHQATTARGPALVIVPMDDWAAEADPPREDVAAAEVVRSTAADPEAVERLAELLDGARSPAIVAGASADEPETWEALVEISERLLCPVWQEAFGGRAGFPQDHPHFAGYLPADRTRLRALFAPHDVVLSVGAPVFRQYPYEPGLLVEVGTRVAVVSQDPAEVHRSPVELGVVGEPAAICSALAPVVARRSGPPPEPFARPAAPAPPASGAPLRAGHVLAGLAERLPADTVLIEEAPSNKPELHARIPARRPLGFLSPAMGGLGFALPAAIGVRMALPDRPVVAVVGDGSSLYGIQALWSAGYYEVGAVFVILANGGYAVMDQLVDQRGGSAPWPGFGEVQVAGLAQSLGCPAMRVTEYDELVQVLDDVVPNAGARDAPLLLEVVVEPDERYGY